MGEHKLSDGGMTEVPLIRPKMRYEEGGAAVYGPEIYLDEQGNLFKRRVKVPKTIQKETDQDLKYRDFVESSKVKLDQFVEVSKQEIAMHQKSLTEDIEEIKNNIKVNVEKPQIKLVEVLGFFVGIFTFVSVEFQVLRNVTSILSATGLTLILLGGIVTMMMLIGCWVRDYGFSKKWLAFVLPVLLCAGGVLLVWHEEESPKSIQNLQAQMDELAKQNMKLQNAIREISSPKSVDCRVLESL